MGFRALLLLSIVAACGGDDGPDESRQGGDTTIDDRTDMAFTHPAANLTADQQSQFMLGTSPFDFRWEIPQLGTLYNNDRCFGCHGSFGRGQAQIGPDGFTDINGPQSEALVRVSLPAGEGDPEFPGGVVPVPGYGDQIQDHATVGLAEAAVTLTWVEHDEMFGDGSTITLRAPHLDIRDLDGNQLPGDMRTSFRIAPPIVGLGLLEAMDLTALADPDDADGDGISGSTNTVWNAETNQMEMGRFGWKANTPTLHVQAAAAANNDMGLSSYIFPDPSGNNDVADDQMDGMAFMVSAVGVPAAAPRNATSLARARRVRGSRLHRLSSSDGRDRHVVGAAILESDDPSVDGYAVARHGRCVDGRAPGLHGTGNRVAHAGVVGDWHRANRKGQHHVLARWSRAHVRRGDHVARRRSAGCAR
ncbi:MAG: di-heme oxidoredictase family protein [Kofleriaceae bacterium]